MHLRFIFLLLVILNVLPSCSTLESIAYNQKNNQQNKIAGPDIDKFITHMATTYNFDYNELSDLLHNATYQAKVIAAIQKPAEKLPWHRYEKIFLSDKRINAGVEFWNQHQKLLQRASKEYGVPEEIIISLIGVETFYGKIKGNFPVLDTLATLAFCYEPRSKFFKSELEQFLLYAREENADPKSFYGSYAGAMGYPQFISSSIRNYAVDFTNSGHRDLLNNPGDAIGSVANYLKKHGWQEKQPITAIANINNKQNKIANIVDTLKPSLTVAELNRLGVSTKISDNKQRNFLASLLKFELESTNNQKNNVQYRLGFNNFYVITRYNNSQNYALAVYLLSEQIKTSYNLKYNNYSNYKNKEV